MERTIKGWRTCDLKAVAALIYSGYKIADHGREGARVFFEFEDTIPRKTTVLQFFNKELTVEPLAFLECLNRARDMVTQALKS